MRAQILVPFILIANTFSFQNSFAQSSSEIENGVSPGCYGVFSIGTNFNIYSYHDYGSDSATINLDTTYNFGSVIYDTLKYTEGGIHCTGCLPYIVTIFNDTGLYHFNFITCLNTNIALNFHVMRNNSPLTVNELNAPDNFQISSNPTENNFTIMNISTNRSSSLEIINSVGAIVYRKQLTGEKDYPITENFAKGVYFVKLNNEVKKMVIE